MAEFPLNAHVPPGYKIPGIYTSVIDGDPGAPAANHRVLCFGYMAGTGMASPNVPFLGTTQEQVDRAVGSSSLACAGYVAAKSQLPQGVGAEVWVLPLLEPVAGTQATHVIQFVPAPQRGVLGTNTAALAASLCEVYVAQRKARFLIDLGDTFSEIASKAQAALSGVARLPVQTSVSGSTVTLTDIHKGEHGNDLPVRVDIANSACGVAASPGSLTFAGNAGADGSVMVNLGMRAATAPLKNANTPEKSAVALREAINADAYACSAATPATPTAVVTLCYRNERSVHRISASVSKTVAPQTVTAAVGTAGSGVPDLSLALAGLEGEAKGYAVWSCFWTDASSWSSVLMHLEEQSRSPVEKGQVAHGCITTPLPDDPSQGLAASTTPVLTSSERVALLWCPGSPNRGWEVCARSAAWMALQGVRNYNGDVLKGNESHPLGAAHRADRPGLSEVNTAIATFFQTPVVPNEDGENAIVRSTTTYKPRGILDEKYTKWSHVVAIDALRAGLRQRLGVLFANKQLKAYSKARTSRATTAESIREAVYVYLKEQDALDLYDGAEGIRDAIVAGIVVSPTRVDVALPFRVPADLDQISIVGIQQ